MNCITEAFVFSRALNSLRCLRDPLCRGTLRVSQSFL